MRGLVEGRSVAIVGRARTLLTSGLGASIDAADVVIRVNWTLPLAPQLARHVGTRTDLLYHCAKICEGPRLAAEAVGVQTHRLEPRYRRSLVRRRGFDPSEYQPNTGTVAVLHAIDSGARDVRVYGFDFFVSGHIGEEIRGPDGKTWGWDHDPDRDRALFRDLARQGLITPDPALAQALEEAA